MRKVAKTEKWVSCTSSADTMIKARVGDFLRCDRAWCRELKEPAWCVIVALVNRSRVKAVILKNRFRPDGPGPFTEADIGVVGTGTAIARTVIVPADEVPDDVLALFTLWRLQGGELSDA
jgi:hypothetical protein